MDKKSGEMLWELGQRIGEQTNNFAEYSALVRGLEQLIKLGAKQAKVYADSELMVRQVLGVYRVKNAGLKPLCHKAQELIKHFDSIEIQHIPREQNKAADALANYALDKG